MFGTNGFDYVAVRLSYSIKEFSLSHDEFRDLLEAQGLEKFVPRKRTPGEVFETVSRKLKKVYHDGGLRYETEVKQASSSGCETLERVIQLTEIDREGRKVSDGRKVARMSFCKTSEEFHYTTLYHSSSLLFDEDDEFAPIPEFILDDIQQIAMKIAMEKQLVSPSQIRNTILKIVSSVGIPVEGVLAAWTIPKSEEHIAESIKNLANDLNARMGRKVIFYDVLPIADDEEIKKSLSGDAIVFATKEFEALLFSEQGRIESADDPNKAAEEAEVRFRAKAQAVMNLIKKHENLTKEVLDKINQSKNRLQKNLKTFEIRLDPEDTEETEEQIAS